MSAAAHIRVPPPLWRMRGARGPAPPRPGRALLMRTLFKYNLKMKTDQTFSFLQTFVQFMLNMLVLLFACTSLRTT